MAYRGKKINNPAAKMSIHFLQTKQDTNGELLEMEATYQPHSAEPVMHYHPYQEEEFAIIEGQLTVVLQGIKKVFQAGETLYVARGAAHAMWNNSDHKTVVNWKVRPAMNTEHLLETTAGLAIDGKVNKKGVPGILQVALIAKKFSNVFRLAKPAFVVQAVLFRLLSLVAIVAGFRPNHDKYLN